MILYQKCISRTQKKPDFSDLFVIMVSHVGLEPTAR